MTQSNTWRYTSMRVTCSLMRVTRLIQVWRDSFISVLRHMCRIVSTKFCFCLFCFGFVSVVFCVWLDGFTRMTRHASFTRARCHAYIRVTSYIRLTYVSLIRGVTHSSVRHALLTHMTPCIHTYDMTCITHTCEISRIHMCDICLYHICASLHVWHDVWSTPHEWHDVLHVIHDMLVYLYVCHTH